MRGVYRLCMLMVLAALFAAVPDSFAQNFKPFTTLRVLETRYFDIIFPGESESSAVRLAAVADAVYEQVSSLLGIRAPGRIPVSITPHTAVFNGYMNPLPYPHIVLFDTPMNIEWTVFSDSLEGLFLHELTHALSLSSRGPFFRALHTIFGGWVMPTALTAPLFMVEGVAVGFESLGGKGRVNDPVVRQRVRQAIHEGIPLTPFQASGVYDKPPLHRAYYEYGGLFTDYLLRTYGVEKYRELWAAMGRRIPVSLWFYRSGFFGLFREVYGVEPVQAWEDFLESLALTGVEDGAVLSVVDGELLIQDVAASGDKVYFLEMNSRKVKVYDTRTGGLRSLMAVDGTAYRLSVHPGGELLLVSSYRYRGDLGRATVTEYRTRDGRPTGRRWEGLYGATYFRDGLAAKASSLHGSRLVYVKDGETDFAPRDLVPTGNAELIYSAPVALDYDRLAFVFAERGVRKLGLFDKRTGIISYAATDLGDDRDRWRHIRGLSAGEGTLLFSYNHDDRLYKLGVLDFGDDGNGVVRFYDRDFSGGVFSPVALGSAVYFRSAFATWDSLSLFPKNLKEPIPLTEEVNWIEWSYAGETTGELPGLVAQRPDSWQGNDPGKALQSKPYSALPYLNPFEFWIPLPLVRWENDSFRIDGGGIFTFLSDPIGHNTFFISVGADLRAGGFGYFDSTWASLGFGLPTRVSFSDGLEVYSYPDGETRYRATRIAGSALLEQGILSEALRFQLKPQVSALFSALDPEDGSGAYEWVYGTPIYSAGLAVGLSNFVRRPWQLFGRGAALELMGRMQTEGGRLRWDALFRTALEPFLPSRITLYGAWDGEGMNIMGESPGYGQAPFAPVAAGEYDRNTPDDLRWIAGGEVEVKLFSRETQRNLSHLYFNRLFATGAFRTVIHSGSGEAVFPLSAGPGKFRNYQTLLVRAGAVISAIPVAPAPLRFSPHLWFALKLSDLFAGPGGAPFQVGVALSLEW